MVGKNSKTTAGHYVRHLLQHNRVTLPKPLVKELGLKYTDKIAFHIVNGTIVGKPHIVAPLVKRTHKKSKVVALDTYITKRKANQKKHRRSLKQVIGIA